VAVTTRHMTDAPRDAVITATLAGLCGVVIGGVLFTILQLIFFPGNAGTDAGPGGAGFLVARVVAFVAATLAGWAVMGRALRSAQRDGRRYRAVGFTIGLPVFPMALLAGFAATNVLSGVLLIGRAPPGGVL
jgi:hypothetical protein